MAKQKRKPAKGKPITTHQLFPAVVALWFGAAFGLGSLAVRPSLIEGLVLKSHIDLVVPAAAPPLGVTARILIALLMAALGAVVGIALARRIARPKPVSHERKRGAKDLGSDAVPVRARDAHPDAPARRPISIHEELGEDSVDAAGQGVLAMRRRALAIEHEEDVFVPHDMAPLPGGSPQVLDIAATKPPFPAEAGAGSGLDLGSFSQPTQPAAPAAAPIDWANAAPVAASNAPVGTPAMIEAQRQVFQPAVGEIAAPAPCAASQAAHADGRQVFGMAPPEPKPEAPRQIFGQAVEGDHVPQEFVRAAGFQTSVFEKEEHSPLFPQRTEQAEMPNPAAEPAAFAGPATAPAPIPQAFEPVQPAPAMIATAAPEPVVAAPVEPAPAEPLPSPAGLGMTDLAARLAESMRRRRAARSGSSEPQPAQPVEPAAAPIAEQAPQPAPLALPEPQAAAPVPQAYMPDPQPVAPIPQAFEPTPIAVEQQMAPVEPTAPTAPAELPSALRPLALDAFIEEDSTFDPGVLPPRHIAMPSPSLPVVPQAAAPAAQAAEPLELEAEDVVPEEYYGSLLGISAPRGGFVRIEDAEPVADAVEPVVIFPGQAPRAAEPLPPVLPTAANAEEPAPFRRFDAPASAGQGQPVAANTAAPAVDAAEAEQALRAALANLQRMSGAA